MEVIAVQKMLIFFYWSFWSILKGCFDFYFSSVKPFQPSYINSISKGFCITVFNFKLEEETGRLG